MTRLNSVLRNVGNACVAVICWVAVHEAAFAAPQQQKQAPPEGSYVFPYALAIFAIALGVMLACRPSRRRDRAKPEQYDSSKQTGMEEE
jgi:hypothetical protein